MKCLQCNVEKGMNEFNKDSSKKSGYDIYCKECRKQQYGERYQKKITYDYNDFKCNKCGVVQSKSNFITNKSKRGHRTECKPCWNKYYQNTRKKLQSIDILSSTSSHDDLSG